MKTIREYDMFNSEMTVIIGIYPINLALPFVAGNEGVGLVEDIGGYVTTVRPGNRVIITTPAQGTWRKYAVFNECVLKAIPRQLGIAEAANLIANSCTAYRMLTDFKPVRQCGGVVIQNGANSACGQNVIQLCREWNVKTINIVRKRPRMNALRNHLCCLGATYVFTEEELQATNIFKEQEIEKPILALNCVGGKNASLIMKQLEYGGFMVTYGGVSRQPVTIPTSAFVFNNVGCFGFWMAAWNRKACDSHKDAMLKEIIELMAEKKLVAPAHKIVKFDKYAFALCRTLKAFQGNKYILDFS